jgi:hypothetical protein
MIPTAKVVLQAPERRSEGKSFFSVRIKQSLYNEVCEYEMPMRLFVLSDIKGNFKVLRNLLLRNGVINQSYQWIFGDGHLVIVGDCFDRHKLFPECLWLIYSLEERARRKGGYVHYILGNNEVADLNGKWRFRQPKYGSSKDIISSRRKCAALYDGNGELWRWLQTKNIIEKIGRLLFVHGGISQMVNEFPYSLVEINQLARGYYPREEIPSSESLHHFIFRSCNSPLYYRGYYHGTANEEQISSTLYKFKVERIITGHTIGEHIKSYFNGRVINVGTRPVNGGLEVLLIENSQFCRVDARGRQIELKQFL